jgi:hypothetical protein
MRPYNGNRHGEAEYNSWTAIPSGSIPDGATRPDGGDHFANMVHVVNSGGDVATQGALSVKELMPYRLEEVTSALSYISYKDDKLGTVDVTILKVVVSGDPALTKWEVATDIWANRGSATYAPING